MGNDDYRNRILVELAEVLKEEREARGLSLTELSARSGLSRPMIGYIEQRVRTPTVDSLIRICLVLEIDASALLKKAQTRASLD